MRYQPLEWPGLVVPGNVPMYSHERPLEGAWERTLLHSGQCHAKIFVCVCIYDFSVLVN